ncbi:MAG TPA: DUF4252 domain-containing protein [bacterium]|nr:DUF4252 domain-containing protein [bacterium]
MRVKWLLTAALWMIVSTLAHAGIEQHPGYVDVARFGLGTGEEATVEVNLRGPMLKLAAAASEEDDPDVSAMISGLEGIFVRAYELQDHSAAGFEKAIATISGHLQQSGWETIVKVRERDERAHIAVKMQGDSIVGMTVLAMDENDGDNEVVFINIVGAIDLARIGRLGRSFDLDVDALDSLEREATKRDSTRGR